MHPHVDETPLPAEQLTGPSTALRAGRIVYDLVYNPPSTRLLQEAAVAGCTTIGGLEMLVAQAHEQFQWWTGVRPPAGVMRTAAEKKLMEFRADENHIA
jgi:shikimate 5-dehydrogenase